MNTKMAGFRWLSKFFAISRTLEESSLSIGRVKAARFSERKCDNPYAYGLKGPLRPPSIDDGFCQARN